MRVEVYGHSNDCVEIDGDICEEFSAYNRATFLHFGDGTVLEVEHCPKDDGSYCGWRVRIAKQGTAKATFHNGKYHGEVPGGKDDKVMLAGDLKSVRAWSSADGPTRQDIEDFFDDFDAGDLSLDQKTRIMLITLE